MFAHRHSVAIRSLLKKYAEDIEKNFDENQNNRSYEH